MATISSFFFSPMLPCVRTIIGSHHLQPWDHRGTRNSTRPPCGVILKSTKSLCLRNDPTRRRSYRAKHAYHSNSRTGTTSEQNIEVKVRANRKGNTRSNNSTGSSSSSSSSSRKRGRTRGMRRHILSDISKPDWLWVKWGNKYHLWAYRCICARYSLRL